MCFLEQNREHLNISIFFKKSLGDTNEGSEINTTVVIKLMC